MFIRTITVALAFALGACSPALYNKEIESFSKSLTVMQASLVSVSDQAHEATIEVAARGYLENDIINLQVKVDCAPRSPENCGLEEKIDGKQFPQEKLGKKMLVLMKEILTYAKSLSELAGTEDSAKVDDAVGKLGASITSLADEATKANSGIAKTTPKAIIVAAPDFLSWAVGAYVDQKRYNAMKATVTTALPIMAETGAILKDLMPKFNKLVIASLNGRLDNGIQYLNNGEPGATVHAKNRLAVMKDLATTSARIRAVASIDSNAVIDKMLNAHTKLAEAIKSGKGQGKIVFEALKKFADQLKALAKAASVA
ncbi:MAG: hypothetical protein JKY94_02135 [Rhodobacteraceae bacterium]|nr:hypothetical protein [Paracoccaceae bacterium]